MAFTIGAPDRARPRKHSVTRPQDFLGAWLGFGQTAEARERAAQCELRVATCLAELPETYVVFRDFCPQTLRGRQGRWRADNVVVGPSGVFLIETECAGEQPVPPASASKATATAVRRLQHVATGFRASLREWCGEPADVFVKPVLVYADDAYVEKLREGSVKVLPLRWLCTEITERSFEQLTPDDVYHIAAGLLAQLPAETQAAERLQLERLATLADSWFAQQQRLGTVLHAALR